MFENRCECRDTDVLDDVVAISRAIYNLHSFNILINAYHAIKKVTL